MTERTVTSCLECGTTVERRLVNGVWVLDDYCQKCIPVIDERILSERSRQRGERAGPRTSRADEQPYMKERHRVFMPARYKSP